LNFDRLDTDTGTRFSPMKRVRISTDDEHSGRLDTAHVSQARGWIRQGQGSGGADPAAIGASTAGDNSYIPTFAVPESIEQPFNFDLGTTVPLETGSQSNHQSAGGASTSLVTEKSPPDLGHGTLVMSRSGASSRYFGHTAASEWLKDVSQITK
jgi:hypothetical protein